MAKSASRTRARASRLRSISVKAGKSAQSRIGRRTTKQKALDGGRHGRRLRAIPVTTSSLDTQIRRYGKTLLARARYLSLNNPYIASAKEWFVSALIADGIKPSWLMEDKDVKRAYQQVFRDWTDQADADGITDYYGLQYMIAEELFDAGECFVRFRPRRKADGVIVPFQLQLLPSEMLPVDFNRLSPGAALANGAARIESGIEFDSIGRRTGYYFYKNHPGNDAAFDISSASYLTNKIPADQILHIMLPQRAGQIRGIPVCTPSITTMAMLDLYDDAELERKRTAALFGGFITRKAGDDGDDTPLGTAKTDPISRQESFGLEPGVVAELEEGQDIKFANPADVGPNFDFFQYRALTRGASGMGVPFAGMTGDLKGTSFGSLRGGMVDSKRRVSAKQNHFLITQFCCKVIEYFVETAILYGALPTTPVEYFDDPLAYTRVKHISSKWDWIDPAKDMAADVQAVENGFKARSDVIESMGEDAEETDMRIAQDKERADSLGLQFPLAAATTAAGVAEIDGGSNNDPNDEGL